MPSQDPKTPLRADHRFMEQMVRLTLKGKADPKRDEIDRVGRVFSRMGGSWEGVFKGSPEDIDLLKKVLKAGLKGGFLSKKERWT
jgi:hypothetical protein